MLKPVILWVLWVLCALAMYIFGDNALTLLLLALSVLIPPLTYLVSSIALRGVSASLSFPFVMQKGKDAECAVVIKSRSLLPLWRMRCRAETQNLLTGEKGTLEICLSLMPKSQKEIRFRVGSEYCGRINVTMTEIGAFDPFSIFRTTAKSDALARAMVYPDTFEAEVSIALNNAQLEDCDEYSPNKPGWDRTETFQIREYVDGDSIRQIHWKLTTKYDKIIIRDPALPVLRSVLVMWDKSLPAEVALTPSVSDAMGEAFVSVCKSLVDRSISFHVAYNDPAAELIELFEVNDLAGLSEVTARLLSVAAVPGADSAAELYERMSDERRFSTVVYLSEYIPSGIVDVAAQSSTTALVCTPDIGVAAAGVRVGGADSISGTGGAVGGGVDGGVGGGISDNAAIAAGGDVRVVTFTPADYTQVLFELAL